MIIKTEGIRHDPEAPKGCNYKRFRQKTKEAGFPLCCIFLKKNKKMRNGILLLLLAISTAAFGQATDCKEFKNGKFKIADPELGNFFVERKGSKQIEYSDRHPLKMEFRVKWLNDCTYTLELKKVLENPENVELTEGLILTIEILETKEKSYVQRTSSNMYEDVLVSEMIKMDN